MNWQKDDGGLAGYSVTLYLSLKGYNVNKILNYLKKGGCIDINNGWIITINTIIN